MRKLIVAVAGSALVAIATLSAPGTATAGPGDPAQRNPIKATVKSDGTWTREGHAGRHKTDVANGDIELNLNNNVDGGLCVKLYDTNGGAVFSDEVCWGDGEYGAKKLATGVKKDTVFLVDAKKGRAGSNNDWGGFLFY